MQAKFKVLHELEIRLVLSAQYLITPEAPSWNTSWVQRLEVKSVKEITNKKMTAREQFVPACKVAEAFLSHFL